LLPLQEIEVRLGQEKTKAVIHVVVRANAPELLPVPRYQGAINLLNNCRCFVSFSILLNISFAEFYRFNNAGAAAQKRRYNLEHFFFTVKLADKPGFMNDSTNNLITCWHSTVFSEWGIYIK
jgi:hypothetical protein